MTPSQPQIFLQRYFYMQHLLLHCHNVTWLHMVTCILDIYSRQWQFYVYTVRDSTDSTGHGVFLCILYEYVIEPAFPTVHFSAISSHKFMENAIFHGHWKEIVGRLLDYSHSLWCGSAIQDAVGSSLSGMTRRKKKRKRRIILT